MVYVLWTAHHVTSNYGLLIMDCANNRHYVKSTFKQFQWLGRNSLENPDSTGPKHNMLCSTGAKRGPQQGAQPCAVHPIGTPRTSGFIRFLHQLGQGLKDAA
jgi:hypothetical protein